MSRAVPPAEGNRCRPLKMQENLSPVPYDLLDYVVPQKNLDRLFQAACSSRQSWRSTDTSCIVLFILYPLL